MGGEMGNGRRVESAAGRAGQPGAVSVGAIFCGAPAALRRSFNASERRAFNAKRLDRQGRGVSLKLHETGKLEPESMEWKRNLRRNAVVRN